MVQPWLPHGLRVRIVESIEPALRLAYACGCRVSHSSLPNDPFVEMKLVKFASSFPKPTTKGRCGATIVPLQWTFVCTPLLSSWNIKWESTET